MLAQSFMTAKELQISDKELAALIKVLGMLERGDLKDAMQDERCDNGFNMGTQGAGCGTPACIGGWVATLMNVPQMKYVDSYMLTKGRPQGISNLYWTTLSASVEQAAIALRNFLTTGQPRWDLALAP